MEFDIRGIAAETNAAWRSDVRTINADGVTAHAIELRKGENKVLENLKPLIDAWRENPERVTGTAETQSPESFIALTNRHGKEDFSVLFCDAMSAMPSIQAVIDYHGEGADPRRAVHRIRYGFSLSKEWQFWMGIAARGRLEQADFAYLIEQRIADVVKGDKAEEKTLADQMQVTIATPAELLTLSRGLQIRVDQVVKEVLDLGTGADQIAFEENHKGENGKPIKVPGMFVLALPVFQGDEAIRLPMRLRYRVMDRKTYWFVEPYRADKVLIDTVKAVAERAQKETGLPLFYGYPEK